MGVVRSSWGSILTKKFWERISHARVLSTSSPCIAKKMAMPTLPNAALFTLKETANSGRGAFPTTPLAKGTPLLSTDIISAHVINREYRKEVCAQCFGYERSRTLKTRDTKVGMFFCSVDCQLAWRAEKSPEEVSAYDAIESFVKSKSKGQKQPLIYDGVNGGFLPDASSVRPSIEQIDYSWSSISSTADFIRQAREGSQAKPHVRALQAALAVPPAPNVLSFLLSGTLCRAFRRDDWQHLKALVADPTPYTNLEDLEDHVYSYLHLLVVLPVDLLSHVRVSTCRTLATRDSHNSFGIRSLDDEGSEYFGFAVWPEASYFNHSCEPNVGKRRVGKTWEFWLLEDVKDDTELCITYLGGEERELIVNNRRTRLMNTWGFECDCRRCAIEDAERRMENLYLGGEDGRGQDL